MSEVWSFVYLIQWTRRVVTLLLCNKNPTIQEGGTFMFIIWKHYKKVTQDEFFVTKNNQQVTLQDYCQMLLFGYQMLQKCYVTRRFPNVTTVLRNVTIILCYGNVSKCYNQVTILLSYSQVAAGLRPGFFLYTIL